MGVHPGHFFGNVSWEYYYAENLGIQTSDRILASVIIFSSVVGALGNISALCYFWTKRCKTIPDLLYLAISATDVISVSLFPLSTISLVNDRKRMLFNNEGFCTAWSSVITFTARMSMFLAMMICITRTIAMKYPFFHIKRSWLIGAISGYAGYMIVFYLIYLSQKWHYGGYSYELSSCLLVTLNFRSGVPVFAAYFGAVSFVLELLLPSVVTFVCFFVGMWVLMARPAVNNEKEFRRVSVSISIFTAAFLMCNLPCSLYVMWDYLGLLNILPLAAEVLVKDRRYLFYYSQLMLQYFPVFLNAVINPLIYLLRMRGYQNWVCRTLRSPVDRANLST